MEVFSMFNLRFSWLGSTWDFRFPNRFCLLNICNTLIVFFFSIFDNIKGWFLLFLAIYKNREKFPLQPIVVTGRSQYEYCQEFCIYYLKLYVACNLETTQKLMKLSQSWTLPLNLTLSIFWYHVLHDSCTIKNYFVI